ncbi:MAG TPA: hypothetical protein VFC44_13425 [Candidatus Saccharimonadales bacterium]|nr:hypothetical protein [Candidatus Saccharimonadales bacterium]
MNIKVFRAEDAKQAPLAMAREGKTVSEVKETSGRLFRFKLLLVIAFALLAGTRMTSAAVDRSTIDLNGTWQFQLDPKDEGGAGLWYAKEAPLTDSIRVPGCWQAQGFGEPLGILRNSYCGPAWYRRTVGIPKQWEDKTILLHIGAAFRQVQLFVNGVHVGDHDGFCTGFQFDITDQVKPGAPNLIAFRINNPGQVITNGPGEQVPCAPTGSINYLGNWGGIFGNVSLEATETIAIAKTRITPDLEHERVIFKIMVQNRRPEPTRVRLAIKINNQKSGGEYQTSGELSVEGSGTNVLELTIEMPDAKRWTPDEPFLYTAGITLESHGREIDKVEERFGMREITTRADVLLLNGKPLYLRAYGDDSVWVRSGVPPASREDFLKQLRLTKSYGFNCIRFHSSVPVREVFEAADEVGMLIMAELPAAYSRYFLPFTNFYKAELTRVLDVYHNHPSFLSLAFGDELWPVGNEQEKKAYREAIAEFYYYAKKLDSKTLILSNDGNRLPPSDMESAREHVLMNEGSLNIPFILHEFGGYYCSLPDVSLWSKFDGVLIPTWLTAKEQWLRTNGLTKAYETYLENSQRLLNVGRKYQIEAARRNPGVSGYEYWLITDFPGGAGEGDSWEEGWFDYFWQPKRVNPQEGRMLNSPVLMMIDPGVTEATLWNDSPKDFKVWVSNFGQEEIRDGCLRWTLKSGSKTIAESQCNSIHIGLGKVAQATHFEIPAVNGKTAQKLDLILELKADRNTFVNRWNLWSFPRLSQDELPTKQVATDMQDDWISRGYSNVQKGPRKSGKLWLTSQIDTSTIQFAQNGGSVFFLARTNGTDGKANAQFFPSSGGALGTLISSHPALRDFPHDGFCDLQFYHLITGSRFYTLDEAPEELTPIVEGIRTSASWLSKKKDLSRFAYVFEVRIGKGKMLVCSLRLADGIAEGRPEAIFLFDRLLRYAAGNEFKPKVQASQSLLARLLPPHGAR